MVAIGLETKSGEKKMNKTIETAIENIVFFSASVVLGPKRSDMRQLASDIYAHATGLYDTIEKLDSISPSDSDLAIEVNRMLIAMANDYLPRDMYLTLANAVGNNLPNPFTAANDNVN